MPSYSHFPRALVARLGACVFIGGAVFLAQAEAPGAHINSIKLKVNIDHSANCRLSLSASIEASEMGTVWYRFSGPPGVEFDFGGEGTKTLQFDRFCGAGRGAKFTADIHGVLRVEAAMIDANGQSGVELSDSVPADYTCGNGSAIARVIPQLPASKPTLHPAPSRPALPPAQRRPMTVPGAFKPSRPATVPGFRVTEVKVSQYTSNFNGSCPTDDMLFRWTVSTDGPGSVLLRFMQESRPIRVETLIFSRRGTRVVNYKPTHMGSPGGHYQGWIGIEVLSPNPVPAAHEGYTMQCAPRVK